MKNNLLITGIILAGGKSKRMGEDKSFIPFYGKPLIEILINKLSSLFKELIIITNKPHLYPVRKFLSNGGYEKYGISIQPDILKDRGPLGGIYTGLISSRSQYNFIVACDMPFLNLNLVRYMLEEADDYDVVVPEYNGRTQPLCAVYSKDCIETIENQLHKKNLKIIDFFPLVKVRRITEDEIVRLDSGGLCFANINTPQDYQLWGQVSS